MLIRLRTWSNTLIISLDKPYQKPLTVFLSFHTIGIMKSKEIILSLSALAQESRLALFRLLVKRGPQGFTPTQLIGEIGCSGSDPLLSFERAAACRPHFGATRRPVSVL